MKKRITIVTVLALVLACAMLFAACTPASNPDTAKEKLEKKGYTVSVDFPIGPTGLSILGITGVKKVVQGYYSDENSYEYICIIYFSSPSDVKEAIDKVKSFVNVLTKFNTDFDLVSGRYVVDAKSIMGIFSLDLSKPIDLNIQADEGEELDNILKTLAPYIIS